MPNVDVVRLKLLCKDAVGRVKLTLTRGVADRYVFMQLRCWLNWDWMVNVIVTDR
jgi:hypothetical protein